MTICAPQDSLARSRIFMGRARPEVVIVTKDLHSMIVKWGDAGIDFQIMGEALMGSAITLLQYIEASREDIHKLVDHILDIGEKSNAAQTD